MKEKYCIINLKAYEEVFDINLLEFIDSVERCSAYATELGVNLVLCVNSYDLKQAALHSKTLQIFAQHVDAVSFGSQTGNFPSICALRLGAVGTLISHSERYLNIEETLKTLNHAQEQYLTTCVCARGTSRLDELKKNDIEGLVALEPPELIGGDVSVTSANPQIIQDAVDLIGDSKMDLLVGAGIKTREDVKKAMDLGAKGILVASGVIKAKNVEFTLKDLLAGFKEQE